MSIEIYIVKKPLEIHNVLFLEGDIIYTTKPICGLNKFEKFSRKIFKGDRTYIGNINDEYFEIETKGNLEEFKGSPVMFYNNVL